MLGIRTAVKVAAVTIAAASLALIVLSARSISAQTEAWKAPYPMLLTPEGARRLGLVIERLEGAADFTAPAIERVVRALTEELGLKLVDLAQLARLAVTGRTASPPIFDVLALLGRDEALARLRRARAVAEGAA